MQEIDNLARNILSDDSDEQLTRLMDIEEAKEHAENLAELDESILLGGFTEDEDLDDYEWIEEWFEVGDFERTDFGAGEFHEAAGKFLKWFFSSSSV